MHNHRQNADISDLRTSRVPWTVPDLVGALCAVIVILALYMTAQAADDRADAAERAAEVATRTDVESAYERGVSDAVSALGDGPDGTRLARTCAAVQETARP